MSRTVKIAATQMDANPAPTAERLARAEKLATQAAQAGAQLVVLPELFNTGYIYSDENFSRAERIDGPTASWMKNTAARLGIHLAGSLMLLDQNEIYNALLLFAPDGRMWRYNKNYPWGYERGYFREGHGITIAQTELGAIGMLICWDVGHLNLWKRYAGLVDLMMISSCPPTMTNPTYHLPDGSQLKMEDMGSRMAALKDAGRWVFVDTVEQQTAWLGAPTVTTTGCGHIRTPIPRGQAVVLGMLPIAPHLIKYLSQAKRLEASCDMIPACKILDAKGQVLAELTQEQGENLVVAEVALADKTPNPYKPQPASPTPPEAYWLSDGLLPWLCKPIYRRGTRRAWGEQMAPVPASTRRRVAFAALVIAIGVLIGWICGRRKACCSK